MFKQSFLPILAVLVLAGCATTPPPAPAPSGPDLAAEEKSLRDLEAAWTKEFAGKSPEKQAAHYAPDAVLVSPGAPAMKGAGEILKGMKEMMADPNLQLEFATEKVDLSRDATLASTAGSYKMSMTDPKTKKIMHDAGTYATVYRKQDGKWLAVIDIASSSGAPAPPGK
jgi:uncharacterized protein (TIGR02246 family)